MSGSGLNDVQQAMYVLLTGNAPFMAKAKAVLDYVPDSKPYPYVTFGTTVETPFDTFGKDGHSQIVTMDIWSQARGWKEANDIFSDMTTLLENGALVLTAHQQVLVNLEDANQLREDDGITFHIAARYRVIVQDN